MKRILALAAVAASGLWLSCASARVAPRQYDVLIRNGTVYDGSGGAPFVGDVAIDGDHIVAVAPAGAPANVSNPLRGAHGKTEIDAHGQAVAPGFVNMLSWATESLLVDGRSQGDIRQGVTLEVFGEGWSMGPINEAMKKESLEQQGDVKYDIDWTTLGGYLDSLARRGISPNVASFVGATTVRIHELGYADRPPTSEELARMKDLVRQAMREGALGVGSALIYPPGFYAKTDELVELNKASAEFGGRYISHMRSEGNRLLEAIDELITIAREAGVGAEIYHLKAAGEANWPKMDQAIAKVNAARAAGLDISANDYTYLAGGTGLSAMTPPWVQEGGFEEFRKRLQDPAIRQKVVAEMRTPTDKWENLGLLVGSPDRILLAGFNSEKLKPLNGKTLAAVAGERGKSAEETVLDLIVEDDSPIGAMYFLMSEPNLEKQLRQPWVALGSDAESAAPEGVFLKSPSHPRAYGNFARLLARYVREEKVIPLEEAVRRLTSLPATNLKIKQRGFLRPGYFADVVVFDPRTIADHATYEKSQVYATGVSQVFVNGVQVLKDGEHTGAKPGRVVRGPGYRPPAAPQAARGAKGER